MRYFQCYPDNFLVGTAGMRDEQFAVYVRLFMLIYAQGGPIDYNADKLKFTIGKRPQDIRRIVDQLVTMGKLTLGADGRLHNGRAASEIAKWAGRWRSNEGVIGESNGVSNGPSAEPKSATNTTRAHAVASTLVPDTRIKYRDRPPSHSTASARTFQGSLIDALRQHQREMNNANTKPADQHPEIPPSDRGGSPASPRAPGSAADDDGVE